MDKVSRPMQIALLATALFAVVWFVALKPKNDAAEPVAATPASTPVPTSRPVDAGGSTAQSGYGKAVESANNAAAGASTQAENEANADGTQSETPLPAASSASTSSASTAPAATPASTTPGAATKSLKATKTAKSTKASDERSTAQRRADHVVEKVAKDLAARRAVVVLVWSPQGTEDKILKARVSHEIDRRHGRVRVYYVPVSQVGLYEGLIGSLNLGQTPSTVVIAPDHEAQVLGGLQSTARIDRLTSAALLIKPSATPKP